MTSSFKSRVAALGDVLHARDTQGSVQELPLDDVIPDPDQPRKEFDADELAALAKSIGKRGVLQPITVRPADANGKYMIHMGERRWRASRMAGRPTIRAIVQERAVSDKLVEQVIENEQRANLRTSEMVEAVQTMLGDGLSKAAIAEELSCKPADITQYAALAQMADHLRALIDEWPRRALYDLHVATRKFPEAVARFVAKQRGDSVTVAAVASFVRGLKEPVPIEAAATELAVPQGKGRGGKPASPPVAPLEAAPAPGKGKGRRKAAPAPVVAVTVDGRSGRLILPDMVAVLFEGDDVPVEIPASALRLSGASA